MNETSSGPDLFNDLAHEFAERYRRGERPGLSEYTDKYPELAAEILDLFPALMVVEQFGSPGDAGHGVAEAVAAGPPPQQLGEYRILRQIHAGGQGVVYEAVQEPLGRHVALKVLPPALATPERLERFRREARAAARLHHTNIVPVFGVGEHQGIHYYAMQFILGQDLSEVLAEVRRLRGRAQTGPVATTAAERHLAASVAEGLVTGHFPESAAVSASPSSPQARDASFSRDPAGSADGQPPRVERPPGMPPALPAGSRLNEDDVVIAQKADKVGPSPSHLVALSVPSLTAGDSQPPLIHSDMTSQPGTPYYRSVAQIGIQVADALDYAHRQKILHRDIKPSNLLLDTAGRVWVTDFGLAKSDDFEQLTQIGDVFGTLCYMAPERFQGKADERSDVYGLGITLYELLTLRPAFEDSQRPRLIQRVMDEEPVAPRRTDPLIPRDLETVVLTAMAKEPAARYSSAAALAEDLRRFLADRPPKARRSSAVEKIWRWGRRNPGLASALCLVAASLLAVAFVSTLSAIWLKVKRDQVAEAERKARLREADALVGQAHGTRLSRRPGQRFEALAALEKAAAIGRELDQPPEWFDRLRNEAIAALALPDIHITQEWDGFSPDTVSVELSDDFELYVRTTDRGLCTIHRVVDNVEVARLPELGEKAVADFGSGRILALRGEPSGRFQLWDLNGASPALRFEQSGLAEWTLAKNGRLLAAPVWILGPNGTKLPSGVAGWRFRNDGRLLALEHNDRSISVYEVATATRLYRLSPSEVPTLELHPTAPYAAGSFYHSRLVQVRDLRSGQVVASVSGPGPLGNGTCAWSPDGRTLTVPSGDGGAIQQYAFDPVSPGLELIRTIDGPEQGGSHIVYNPAGDRFVRRGWDGTVRLFDGLSGQLLFSTHSLPSASYERLRFDRTGQRLASARVGDRLERIGLWSVADGREYRALVHSGRGEPWCQPAIHPSGRLAAIGLDDGVALFDVESGRELTQFPSLHGHNFAAFDGAGALLTNGFDGFFRWPVRPDAAKAGRWIVGPPERLPFPGGEKQVSASRDGQVIAQCMWAGYGMQGGGWILHPKSPVPRCVAPGQSTGFCSVSPDGRWVAFAVDARVKVYDSATGRCLWQSPAGPGLYCRFSPDGRWLVTNADGGRLYAVGTWEPGPQLGAGTPWDMTSELTVLGQSNGIYRLVELATGRELARLEDPEQNTGEAALTPDATRLVVRAKNGLRVWELRRIRQELDKLGLDWDAPPYSAVAPLSSPPGPGREQNADTQPLEVRLDLGHLIAREKYSFLLAFFPFHAEAYYQRGLAYTRFGQPREAFNDFNLTLALKPDYAEAYYQRGLAYTRFGQRQEAFNDFNLTLALKPDYADAYYQRGLLHAHFQRFQEASADFARTIALRPKHAEAQAQRAKVDDDYARLLERKKAAWKQGYLVGHTDIVMSVAFSPDGRWALSSGHDNTIRLWDLKTGKEVRRLEGHTQTVWCVVFSPDGRQALSAAGRWGQGDDAPDATVRLWDLASGKELRRLEGHTHAVRGVAFCPDGRHALSGGHDCTLRLWDLATGREVRRFEGHTNHILSVAVSPDGRYGLSASGDDGTDNTVRLWDLASGKELCCCQGHTHIVLSAVFSPDGRQALSASWDKTLRLWDLAGGKELRRFDHPDRIERVAFSPDGRRAASACYDKAVHIWDVSTGRELLCLKGHEADVLSVAFSPDGGRVLSGSADARVRLWHLPEIRDAAKP